MSDTPQAFPAMERFDQYDADAGKYVARFLPEGGMSLRDYFAAKAMQATIARLGPIVKVDGTGSLHLMPDNPAVTEEDGRQVRQAVAIVAYDYADAMLKARVAK
jgi:hypothetical protein